MDSKPQLTVEIWSDIVCPFCYIGKRQFETALKSFAPRNQVVIEWRSFLLDPDSEPIEGESVVASLARRKQISLQESKGLHEKLTKSASEWGLDYHFDTMISANSRAAHRLLQSAKSEGKGPEMKELLLSAYFHESANIGSREALKKIGKAIGLSTVVIDDAWTDSEGIWNAKVEGKDSEGHTLGATGVPFFVFQRKYSLTGAQGPDRFLRALEEAGREFLAS